MNPDDNVAAAINLNLSFESFIILGAIEGTDESFLLEPKLNDQGMR